MNGAWQISLGHALDPMGLAVAGLCLGLAAFEGISSLRRRSLARVEARRGAILLLCLRLLGVAMLLAMLLELTLLIEESAPLRRRVVVLIDDSMSMALEDRPVGAEADAAQSRWDRGRRVWEEAEATLRGWRRDGLDVDVRMFSDATRSVPTPIYGATPPLPDGSSSRLDRALEGISEEVESARHRRALSADPTRSPTTAAIMILSDGLVAADDASDQHVKALVRRLADEHEIPVTTFALGAPEIQDLALTDPHVGAFSFVENVTQFSVSVVAQGYEGRETTIQLLRDGEEIARQPLTLPAKGAMIPIAFEVAPDRVGQFVYEFALSPMPDEATIANNRRSFVVKVLRDKVRALHVAGRPDWDVRALRTLLKRDPNVELLSYYILRDSRDVARDDENAPMSLIAFPTEAIFGSELGSFDLVILQNFDAGTHASYLPNIARYVQEGGALIIIGGDLGLASGDYALPAMAALLPVDSLSPTGLETDPFRPLLTAAGRRHPITAWLGDRGADPWAGLPSLRSFNRTGLPDARHGDISATTLLEHPRERGRARDPLLAVAEPGEGRVLVLTTGASWRLAFSPDLPLIGGARPYDLLWRGAIRWLLRDASTSRIALETGKPSYAPGEAVDLHLRTLSSSYAPEPDVEVEWSVRQIAAAPTGAAEAPDAPPPARTGRWTSDALGKASEHLEDLDAGAYEARAWRDEDPQEIRRVFLVGVDAHELDTVDATVGTTRLREIADIGGGEFFEAFRGDRIPMKIRIADPRTSRASLGARRSVPLWDGWLALIILLIAYPGEWALRRRQGLR